MRSFRRVLKKSEMWMRQRMPAPVRKVYRMLNSMRMVASSEESIPQHLLDGCMFISSRKDLIHYLPARGIVAEVGTFEGQFARKIAMISEPLELHLIDIDFSKFNQEGLQDDSVFLHQGLSHEVLSGFDDNYFDWIYIDAEHTYEAVLRDAETAVNKLKPGGYLVFNDFAHVSPAGGHFGVHRAVVEFCLKYEWKWRYFAFQKSALYDVALQKPDR